VDGNAGVLLQDCPANRVESKMKRALTLVIITIAVGIGFLSIRGAIPFMAVYGNSMNPELKSGDLVVIKKVSASEVEVGDVIIYTVPSQVREIYNYPAVVAHRVVRMYETESGISFRTRGDNVSGEDPLAVREEDLRGKVGKKISHLGFPLLFLQSKLGLIFAIVSLCSLAYYLYADEASQGRRWAYKGLFSPVIEENHRSNRLTERALDKFASAIESYAGHLNSHTSAIQGLSEASKELRDGAAVQNRVLVRVMETVEQVSVSQDVRVLGMEEAPVGEESAKYILPSIETVEQVPVRREERVPMIEQPPLAEESAEDFVPSIEIIEQASVSQEERVPMIEQPSLAEESAEDFVPSLEIIEQASVSQEERVPVIEQPSLAEESAEDFVPSLEIIEQASVSREDTVPGIEEAPLAEESTEDFVPSLEIIEQASVSREDTVPGIEEAPVAEESAEDFVPSIEIIEQASISREERVPVIEQPPLAEESAEDYVPSIEIIEQVLVSREERVPMIEEAPLAEESVEDFVPSIEIIEQASVSREERVPGIGQPPLAEESTEEFLPSIEIIEQVPVSQEERVTGIEQPPVAEESTEEFLPSIEIIEQVPVSREERVPVIEEGPVAEESAEEFLPSIEIIEQVSISREERVTGIEQPPVAEESTEEFLPSLEIIEQVSISQEDTVPGIEQPSLAEESAEDFLPSAFVSDMMTVLELIGQESSLEEGLQSIIESQRKQEALDDCLAVGLLKRVSDYDFVLAPAGKRFFENGAAREILKKFLLSKPNVVSLLEKVGDNPALQPKVLKETLTDINPVWTEDTWERRSKVLTNWLIYAQLLRPTRDRVTSNLARLF